MKHPEAIELNEETIAYRGEGNVTLVIALKNTGKVLRFPKYPFDQIMCRSHLKAKLLHHIWFAKMILKNLINEAMFDEPKLVLVSQEDIELINKLCKKSRPNYRIFKVIPNQESWALLLNDYCCIPSEPRLLSHLTGPVISVEIKPKQGFPPLLYHSEEDKPVEARVCRFALKQAFKLQTMPLKEESHYCPLDLFSGCHSRMMNAIKNLLQTPQNNFRIFRDSELIYSDGNLADLDSLLHGFTSPGYNDEDDDSTTDLDQRSEKILLFLLIKALTLPFENSSVTRLDDLNILDDKLHLCSYHESADCESPCQGDHKLRRKSVLETVLKLQKLDTIGSLNALTMLNHLKRTAPQLAILLDNYSDSMAKVDDFFPLSLGSPTRNEIETEPEYLFRKIWEYLISMIAKDCSIMISMQRINSGDLESLPPSRIASSFLASLMLSSSESPSSSSTTLSSTSSSSSSLLSNCSSNTSSSWPLSSSSSSSPPPKPLESLSMLLDESQKSAERFTQETQKCHIIRDDFTGTYYAVSIAITDLDLKRTGNITEIYKKDLKLIDAFKDHLRER